MENKPKLTDSQDLIENKEKTLQIKIYYKFLKEIEKNQALTYSWEKLFSKQNFQYQRYKKYIFRYI